MKQEVWKSYYRVVEVKNVLFTPRKSNLAFLLQNWSVWKSVTFTTWFVQSNLHYQPPLHDGHPNTKVIFFWRAVHTFTLVSTSLRWLPSAVSNVAVEERFNWITIITLLISKSKYHFKKVFKIFNIFHTIFQDAFDTYAMSLMKVIVMTTGELDYSTMLVESLDATNSANDAPLLPYRESSYLFVALFIFAMTIILTNLLVSNKC